MKKPFNVFKLALLGILLALAVSLGVAESFLPAIGPVGGIRLGLANLIVLLCLYELGFFEALFLDLAKVLLVNLLRGSFLQMGFYMSLFGAIVSFAAMAALYRLRFLTEVGVSSVGSVLHSFAQVSVAAIFLSTGSVFYYYCFLLPISLLTGILMGILTRKIRLTKAIARLKERHGF
jgi:heptaprenyl diphosphate synthase